MESRQLMDGSLPLTGTSVYDTGETSVPYSYVNAAGTMSGTSTSRGVVTATYSYGDTTGSLTLTETYTSSYNGTEPYSYSIMGGSVSGSVHEDGSSSEVYSTTWGLGKDASGSWIVMSGTGYDKVDGQDHLTYSGGGSYACSDTGYSFNGSVTASGKRNCGGGSRIDYTLTNGQWVQASATGYGNVDNGDDWKAGGTGTYTLTDAGQSGGGSTHASSWNGWSSNGNWTLQQNAAGGWDLTGGTGTTKAYCGYNNGFQDGGNNTYQFQTATDTGSGTITDNSLQKYSLDYTIHHNVANGAWNNTGDGTGSFENRRHWNYDGKGTYLNTAFSGKLGEHGGYNLDAAGNWNIALGGDGTWNLSGGTSTYDLTVDGTAWWQGDGQYNTSSTSGTLKDDALDTYLGSVHTKSNVAGGAWITTGDSTFSSSGHDKQTYDGDGNYSTSVGNAIVTGTTSESGLRNSSYNFNGTGHLANGAWTYSGTGFNQWEASDTYGYDGGGTGSTSSQDGSGSSTGYSSSSDNYSITVNENGDFTKDAVFRMDFDLATDGSGWMLKQQTATNTQTASAFSDTTTQEDKSSSGGVYPGPYCSGGPTSSAGSSSVETESETDYSANRTETNTLRFQVNAPPIYTNTVTGSGSGGTYSLSDTEADSQQTMGFGAAFMETSSWERKESDLNYTWTYATAGDTSTANGTVTNENGGCTDVWYGGQHMVHYPWQNGGTTPVTNAAMSMSASLETSRGTFKGYGIGAGITGVTYTPGAADGSTQASADGVTPAASGSGATTQSSQSATHGKSGSFFGKIWNAPNTAIGLVWGGIGWTLSLGKTKIVVDHNAIEFQNHPLMSGAITLGNTISYGGKGGFGPNTPEFNYNTKQFVVGPDGKPVLGGRHEQQHTYQGELLGPLYLPANLIGGISSVVQDSNLPDAWHGPANFMETGPYQPVPCPW